MKIKPSENVNSGIQTFKVKKLNTKTNSKTKKLKLNLFEKMIPPIVKKKILEETNLDRSRKEREMKKKWNKPDEPKAFLHHLNVIVTTQNFDEYLENFNLTKNKSNKFVDFEYGLISTKSKSYHDSDPKSLYFESEEEKICTEFIVYNLLR